MKKLLVLVLGLMASSVLTTRVNTNEMGINLYGHLEAINVNELREIATKYNSNQENLPIQQGNYTIGTTRLRCGYIEQEYIVLSPRRENAGKAYLIYNFDCKVYRIDVDLTMWSSSENLDKTHDTAKLQYKVGYGSWKDSLDLLNDISLSTNRINPEHYTVVLPEGVTSIRFYVESSAVGSRNKGRICIGDMDIYLSGDNQ